MKKIEITIDEMKYLEQIHKEANTKLKNYYKVEKIKENIDYLTK